MITIKTNDIDMTLDNVDVENVSDGTNTMEQLYDMNIAMMLALMSSNKKYAWWSKRYCGDTSAPPGWIIVGLDIHFVGLLAFQIPEYYLGYLTEIEYLPFAPETDESEFDANVITEKLLRFAVRRNEAEAIENRDSEEC